MPTNGINSVEQIDLSSESLITHIRLNWGFSFETNIAFSGTRYLLLFMLAPLSSTGIPFSSKAGML